MRIAVLGYGTVGKSLVQLLDKAGKDIAYILEIPEKCVEKRMVSDVSIIMNDPSVDLVVDALPAVHPSYDFMKEALLHDKHVVTSNKAALCFGFKELMELAEKHGVTLGYEASCGGTIPCIEEAGNLSATNEVTGCYGIMNGTTNFILDKMLRQGADFEETLKEAQKLGFAEADPTADLSGYDVKNKLVILSNTAYHGFVVSDFPTCGIEKISSRILKELEKEEKAIKLLGMSVREGNRYALGVAPVILPAASLEANVPKNFNMFTFCCSNAGEVKLYGQGAGGVPTADAMMRDIQKAENSSCRKAGFSKKLEYAPELLTGTGYFDMKKEKGVFADLKKKAETLGCFFAFEPDFI